MTRVKPVDGLRVRYPDGRVLPAEGAEVDTNDSYWIRRLQDGDVIETEPVTKRGNK